MRETVGIPSVRERDLIISEDFPARVESMSRSGEAEASLMADNFPHTKNLELKGGCVSLVHLSGYACG